mgnify:CR=1 FL=1
MMLQNKVATVRTFYHLWCNKMHINTTASACPCFRSFRSRYCHLYNLTICFVTCITDLMLYQFLSECQLDYTCIFPFVNIFYDNITFFVILTFKFSAISDIFLKPPRKPQEEPVRLYLRQAWQALLSN